MPKTAVVPTRFRHVVSSLLVVAIGGCGGTGSCGGGSALPQGGLPGYQTIEGGGQIRVTASGFSKLASFIPGVISSSLTGGFCKGPGTFGVISFCSNSPGGACGADPGCHMDISLVPGSFRLSVKDPQTLHIDAAIKLESRFDAKLGPLGCSALRVHADSIAIGGDIVTAIDSGTGELSLKVASITNFDAAAIRLSECGIISSIADAFFREFAPEIGATAIASMTPLIQQAFKKFLPEPLGIQGVVDVSQLIGTNPTGPAFLEARLVAGGYASLAGGGLNLGFVTGFNSDADPSTREEGTRADDVPLASEPNRCAPSIPVENFAVPPYSLPTVQRRAITNGSPVTLVPAGEFTGAPESSGDVTLGLSETALNLFGHHLATSGALCMGIGTGPTFPTLELADFTVILPSIATLLSKDRPDPVLLVGRPQRAIGITVGDNTTDSPALTVGISHLEVDLYGFLFQRYVRLLTLDLSADIGVNLVFEAPSGGSATIKPVLVGVSGDSITVKVINSDFVKEKSQELESVLPSLLDVVVQRIGNIRPIAVPSFAGFALSDLSLRRVSTSQDDFLAINGTLRPSAAARLLAETDPFAAEAVAELDAQQRAPQPTSSGKAQLLSVATPSPPAIRNALARTKGGTLPSVTVDVERFDHTTGSPRELEWSWNLDGGMWHEFQSGSPLVISSRAFALQGKYTIGLQSRVKGDYTTVSDVIEMPVVIDSEGPRVFTEDVTWKNGVLFVPVRDAVGRTDVQVAFGPPGAEGPVTEWRHQADAELERAVYSRIQARGEVAVFARDALGNETVELVAPRGEASSGCGCQSSDSPGAGVWVLVGLVGGMVLLRRRRFAPRILRVVTSVGLWAVASVAASIQPGCSCEKSTRCEVAADCDCEGQAAFCVDQMCVCSDTVPLGHVGPYSDLAVGIDGEIWVSAYAQSHGDLVVARSTGGRIPDDAWEWVEGVPDGPVVVSDSKIRNGVGDGGPDVGMYTSIAVSHNGAPMVTYFDVDRGTLRFATKINGTWQLSDIDIGTGDLKDPGSSVVGMYTSLTLRSDNGRPGVAYLAHVHDGAGLRAEVRYAAAQTGSPSGPGDWQTWVVDTGVVPPTDPEHPNFYPLPQGLGLFIDSARNPTNQAPVVAYYDRGSGQLKVSKFNPSKSIFEPAVVLDGSNGVDVGWSPSVQVDEKGKVHVAYVSTTTNDLKYVVEGSEPEIIDDGYRVVGLTIDGLPKPEFHFVGDDVNLIVETNRFPLVVYQDATTQELLLAHRYPVGWERTTVAGGNAGNKKWPGAYGFFASAVLTESLYVTDLFISSWVIHQPINENWVEVFTQEVLE